MPTRSADAPAAGPVAEFFAGVGLLGRGLGLILARPRLFLLGALPPLITSALLVALVVVLVNEIGPLVAWMTPFADHLAPGTTQVIRTAVAVAVVAGAVLVMVLTFTALTLALGSPLYDKLSESVERDFGDTTAPDESLVRGAGRAVRQAVVLIVVSVVGGIVLFGLGLIPVVGQTLVPVLSALFGGWMLGIELVGSTFERHGKLTLLERRQAMNHRRARVLGFTVPCFLLLAIPFAGAAVFPVATAGGTLLGRQLLRLPTQPPVPPSPPHPGVRP